MIWLDEEVVASAELDGYGATRLTIPRDTSHGSHKIVADEPDGTLIGWDAIEIVEESRVGPNGELLAQSGAWILPVVLAGGGLVIAGAALVAFKVRKAKAGGR